MRDPTAMELALRDSFGGGMGITSFTCDSACSLVAPAGFRLEVYQVIISNTGTTLIDSVVGGE